MFRLSRAELSAIAQATALDAFEDETIVHLRELIPWLAHTIGDEGIRRVIHLGLRRARTFGVTNFGLLQFYIEATIYLGSYFDVDPLLPWAGEVLRDRTIANEALRMTRLFEEMGRYLEASGRRDPSVPMATLQNIRSVRQIQLSTSDPSFEYKLIAALFSIEPRRCSYLGEAVLQDHVRRAFRVAAEHGMGGGRGVLLMALLSFELGHGFREDPVYPWVYATLQDPSIEDPLQRERLLEGRADAYFDQMLAFCEGPCAG